MQRMHIDMIGDGEPVSRPAGFGDHIVVEPFYSPVPTTLPNPHSHAPSGSVAVSQDAPSSSVEPPSTTSAPTAPASSSSGNAPRSDDSTLRNQVEILMNELADIRARQALERQSGNAMHSSDDAEDEVPPPDYMSDGRRSPDGDGPRRNPTVRRGGGPNMSEKRSFGDL